MRGWYGEEYRLRVECRWRNVVQGDMCSPEVWVGVQDLVGRNLKLCARPQGWNGEG